MNQMAAILHHVIQAFLYSHTKDIDCQFSKEVQRLEIPMDYSSTGLAQGVVTLSLIDFQVTVKPQARAYIVDHASFTDELSVALEH